jgi:flagellar basal-body rod protein FlgF/flagellar basal-body rod protein FlgG
MVSGKYSALSGAIAREQTMEAIANNLANINTSGFKKDRQAFEAILRGAQQVDDAKGVNFTRIEEVRTDFSQGALRQTNNPLDLSINGEGFFKVRDRSGTYYTRQGHFQLDNNGMVKTPSGHNLLDENNAPLQINESQGRSVDVDSDGNITVDGVQQGKVGVFQVADQDKLVKQGNTLFSLKQGVRTTISESNQIVQGSIELSNINMMEEMVRMTNTLRKFEIYHKAIKSYSTLGEKLNQLGTIS